VKDVVTKVCLVGGHGVGIGLDCPTQIESAVGKPFVEAASTCVK
jgi:hypothetical protein